jgi:hypothetical protein
MARGRGASRHCRTADAAMATTSSPIPALVHAAVRAARASGTTTPTTATASAAPATSAAVSNNARGGGGA